MTVPTGSQFPSTPPPPFLYPKLLPHLVSRLSTIAAPTAALPVLRTALHILAAIRLSPTSTSTTTITHAQSTIPLRALLEISSAQPSLFKVQVLLDGIIAYPFHQPTINDILSRCFDANADFIEIFRIDVIPSLVNRLKSSTPNDITAAAQIFLSVIRAHDELLALALEDSEDLFKALSQAYGTVNHAEKRVKVCAKSDILMICEELIGRVGHGASEEAMVRFMGSTSGSGSLLGTASLRDDWEGLFGSATIGLSEDLKSVMVEQRDHQARRDPRVQSLIQLFPLLPPHLLFTALCHPSFALLPSGSKATPAEQAAPLLDIILNKGDGLPEDLSGLRAAIQGLATDENSVGVPERAATNQKVERRNIWNEEQLDMGRLKLKDDDSSLPTLSTTIPDHLRASIMRLVESQAVEEDERRRALREANLLDEDDEDAFEETDGVLTKVTVGDGDDEDSEELSEADGVKISREASSAGQSRGPSDRQRLDMLRTTYIRNPKVFERDGATRRSNDRKKLREATGWDDGQIEGWRIMLDRDPHKEDILAAHQEKMARSARERSPQRNGEGNAQGEGSSRGGGGGRGRGGRGGGGGGRGGGGGGGGGRGGSGGGSGRGRDNKSGRGHQNAARTRGHDKKMGRMGAI
ncbi:hypothetical protein IAT40_005209 [Kwoniella sp. CBS 6097]